MHLFTPTHFTFYYQQHHLPQLTLKQFPPFPWLTTPLSLRRGVGGEALFPLHYYTFNFQQRHTHNYFISQLRWYCAIIPMNEFCNIIVSPRNSVRVVLLKARGWRGTRLPRVNVRKEIQRRRC